ncbi:heterokaryon incompatibility protein-domain-containing protein [Phaeosphaeriaceae sp. PMI808]|nr:heterokaryon incompatibility protein-domain-containing protein [Phaeosphaeriaceae sp. PMI808]
MAGESQPARALIGTRDLNTDAATRCTKNTEWPDKLPTHLHKPLNPNKKSVRLLEVLPGFGDTPIKCILSQHSLDDNPSYTALSYTWDQDNRKRCIICNEQELEIGDNLWNFLHQFRRQRSLEQYDNGGACDSISRLWIDAVCINQSNLKERNQQVAQMRDIYTKAESVIVWLGLSRGQEELAFILAKYPSLLRVDEFQTELLSFLNKPYWTRVWVVQEFVLAKSVAVWCGKHTANAVAFDSIWREDQALSIHKRLSKAILKSPAWPLFKYRRDFRRGNGATTSSKFRLRDLLLSFSSSQSTETFDKIYGFLGIASNSLKATHAIYPDYSKAPVELLADVLRNQYSTQVQVSDQHSHEFLILLLRILHVSRREFARYILRIDSGLEKHVYVLFSSEFTAPPLSFLGQIIDIGSFEHVNEHRKYNAKSAVTDSSTSLRRFSSSDSVDLISAVTRSETALWLEFEEYGQGEALLHSRIQNSVYSIAQSLSSNAKPVEQSSSGSISTQNQPYQELENTDFQRLLSRSLTDASATYHRALQDLPEHRGYWYRNIATFVGTNQVIGVMCQLDGYRDISLVATHICSFAGSKGSDKALIIQQRDQDGYAIVGLAVIAISKPETETRSITESLQSMFRGRRAAPVRSFSSSSSQPEAPVLSMCFHCHLTDLLELNRCGILNEEQLDCLLEHSLEEANENVHKCKIGMKKYPILQFGP